MLGVYVYNQPVKFNIKVSYILAFFDIVNHKLFFLSKSSLFLIINLSELERSDKTCVTLGCEFFLSTGPQFNAGRN